MFFHGNERLIESVWPLMVHYLDAYRGCRENVKLVVNSILGFLAQKRKILIEVTEHFIGSIRRPL